MIKVLISEESKGKKAISQTWLSAPVLAARHSSHEKKTSQKHWTTSQVSQVQLGLERSKGITAVAKY